jgi:hypothetical protein
MKRSKAINILRRHLNRIEGFDIVTKDTASRKRIETFLNDFDPAERNRQIECDALIKMLKALPPESDKREFLELIEPEVTKWATTVIDIELFDKLVSVAVRFSEPNEQALEI